MRKSLLCAVSLALAALLSGCGHEQPTPEDAMAQETLNILQDETPVDASFIWFDSEHGEQRCGMYYGDQSVYATLPLPPTQFAIAFSALKDGLNWKTRNPLTSITNNPGSESLSAGNFKKLVQQCVDVSNVRRNLVYSQSVRAANALSWAQAAEARKNPPSVESLLDKALEEQRVLTLQAREAQIDRQMKVRDNQTITVLPSKDDEPVIQLNSGAPLPVKPQPSVPLQPVAPLEPVAPLQPVAPLHPVVPDNINDQDSDQ